MCLLCPLQLRKDRDGFLWMSVSSDPSSSQPLSAIMSKPGTVTCVYITIFNFLRSVRKAAYYAAATSFGGDTDCCPSHSWRVLHSPMDQKGTSLAPFLFICPPPLFAFTMEWSLSCLQATPSIPWWTLDSAPVTSPHSLTHYGRPTRPLPSNHVPTLFVIIRMHQCLHTTRLQSSSQACQV